MGNLLFLLVLLCAGAGSINYAARGEAAFQDPPSETVLRWAIHPCWVFAAWLLLVGHIGEFARGENSPLPWVAYDWAARRHGAMEGLLSAVSVVLADLWLLVLPAQVYIVNRPDSTLPVRRLARGLNVTLGLLLVTPGNPLYWLLGLFAGR